MTYFRPPVGSHSTVSTTAAVTSKPVWNDRGALFLDSHEVCREADRVGRESEAYNSEVIRGANDDFSRKDDIERLNSNTGDPETAGFF